jgi:hypothetical protein
MRFRLAWQPELALAYDGPPIVEGGITQERVAADVTPGGYAPIALGRLFLSNPDLPSGIHKGGSYNPGRPTRAEWAVMRITSPTLSSDPLRRPTWSRADPGDEGVPLAGALQRCASELGAEASAIRFERLSPSLPPAPRHQTTFNPCGT